MHNVSPKIAKTANPHTIHFKIHSKLHHTIHLTIHLNTRAILRWEFAARLKPGVKLYLHTSGDTHESNAIHNQQGTIYHGFGCTTRNMQERHLYGI